MNSGLFSGNRKYYSLLLVFPLGYAILHQIALGQTSRQVNNDYLVRGFRENVVVLHHYVITEMLVPTPNIIIAPEASRLIAQLDTKWISDPSSAEAFLVEHGLARVKDSANTPQALRDLQAFAQHRRRGIWKPNQEEADSISKDNLLENIASSIFSAIAWTAKQIIEFWKELVALGLVGGIGGLLYKKLWIERQVELLIIGKQGAGKSAVCKHLISEKVTEQDILSLTTTPSSEKYKFRKPLPMGRFEILLSFEDVPGPRYGSAFDALISRNYLADRVLLLVLAPTMEVQKKEGSQYDHTYIQQQVGYAQAFVLGTIERRAHGNVALVIIFVNKFDLF